MEEIMKRAYWVVGIRGIVALLFGILAMTWPDLTLGLLIMFVGVFIFLDGLITAAGSLDKRTSNQFWWITFISGLISITIGIIALFWTGIFGLTLMILIGIWAVLYGLSEIIKYFMSSKESTENKPMILPGIIAFLFGLLFIFWPGATALTFVWLIGLFAIIYGLILLVLAMRIRGVLTKT